MKTVPEMIAEIQASVDRLESKLVGRLDAGSVSVRLPFHVLQCREALAWRLAELSRDAFDALSQRRLTSSILLIRAAMETTAQAWDLRNKVKQAVDGDTVAEVSSFVTRLLLGSRTSPDLPDAINVLTFIDAANREFDGLRKQYDHLSEFAHPNWAGTSHLYSKPDLEARSVQFGRNIRGFDGAQTAAVVNLSVALLMFEAAYDGLTELTPPFVQLCERHLQGAV